MSNFFSIFPEVFMINDKGGKRNKSLCLIMLEVEKNKILI